MFVWSKVMFVACVGDGNGTKVMFVACVGDGNGTKVIHQFPTLFALSNSISAMYGVIGRVR